MFYYEKEDRIPRGCELRSFRIEIETLKLSNFTVRYITNCLQIANNLFHNFAAILGFKIWSLIEAVSSFNTTAQNL